MEIVPNAEMPANKWENGPVIFIRHCPRLGAQAWTVHVARYVLIESFGRVWRAEMFRQAVRVENVVEDARRGVDDVLSSLCVARRGFRRDERDRRVVLVKPFK